MSVVQLLTGAAGVGFIAVARVYHLFVHPEWTEAQSLIKLWPMYLVGAVLAFVSAWMFNKKAAR